MFHVSHNFICCFFKCSLFVVRVGIFKSCPRLFSYIRIKISAGDKMLQSKSFFKDGVLKKDALVAFVKEVKKYPGLSEEDAALLAAQK